ncbi:hypothetical protein OTB16_09935 [Streptomyces sp. H27-S2]|nr:hypothetical protein [Streptomyces sp. H27-S2]
MTVGTSQTLRRHSWSHQIPAHRAVKRDDAAATGRG